MERAQRANALEPPHFERGYAYCETRQFGELSMAYLCGRLRGGLPRRGGGGCKRQYFRQRVQFRYMEWAGGYRAADCLYGQ